MLRLSWISLPLVLIALVGTGRAQETTNPYAEGPGRRTTQQTQVDITTSPEIWFYQQQRELYEDPKMMVRRRAELKGQQRAERLASQKWFGTSNSRPTVSCTPAIGGSFSPYWSSNSFDPYRWRPYEPIVVMPGVMRY